MANVTGKICALLLATAATAAALIATTALAGSGVGANFNLGQTNTVDATSVLTGSSAGQLKVQNNSTADATFGVFGLINPTAPGANSVAVKGQNNGTGNAGTGVTGTHAGGGTGVFGTAATGTGVYGKHTAATGSGTWSQGRVRLGQRAGAPRPEHGRRSCSGPAGERWEGSLHRQLLYEGGQHERRFPGRAGRKRVLEDGGKRRHDRVELPRHDHKPAPRLQDERQ